MGKDETKILNQAEKGKEAAIKRPARGLSPFEEMDKYFDRMLGGYFPHGFLRPFRMDFPTTGELAPPFEGRLPKVDVVEHDAELLVRAELPGVSKDELEVSITDDSVTIKSEVKRESKEEKGDYHRHEISRGSFARTVGLPQYVDTEKAKAVFKDGVLELTLPKVEKTKRRKIAVE